MTLPVSSLLESGGEVHITGLGDSLTVGYMVEEGYFPQFLDLLRERYPLCRLTASNHGSCGDSAAGGLRRFTQAARPVSQLALVQFGLNDAYMGVSPLDFRDSLRQLVVKFQALGSQVLLVPPPVLREDSENRIAAPFIAVHKAVARATGALIADIESAWQRHIPQSDLWLFDGVHPSEEGYAIMARAVLDALDGLPVASAT